jgi:hypothetical protein
VLSCWGWLWRFGNPIAVPHTPDSAWQLQLVHGHFGALDSLQQLVVLLKSSARHPLAEPSEKAQHRL